MNDWLIGWPTRPKPDTHLNRKGKWIPRLDLRLLGIDKLLVAWGVQTVLASTVATKFPYRCREAFIVLVLISNKYKQTCCPAKAVQLDALGIPARAPPAV